MKTILCFLAAFGLALAVSAQQQPRATVQSIKPLDVPIPPLERRQKPNFIVIVTDDQGWDDIGRNNPRYVHTPNLDRFIQEGTFFDNYYVTPQCAQSRAAMLTGRYSARVGTMLVNGAWDFINSNEVTAAKLLDSENYATAQFGKWHNSEVQGYEPWSPMVGFKKADIPVSNDGTSNMRLMRTNGTYTAAKGDIERVLLAKMLRYLNKRDESSRPFYIYYAPHSIHLLYEKINGVRQTHQIRFSPAKYRQKFYNDPQLKGLNIANATIDAWAALEYLDDVLGTLFSYLKETGLDKTTYVMVMSDNGSAMTRDEKGPAGTRRMPSGMKGDKSTIWEGGIRNFLAVQGPGVQAGVVDSTLLHIIDILPTVADLAGIRKGTADHMPWDGISFKNLLLAGSGVDVKAPRNSRKAVPEAANALGEDLPAMLGTYRPPVAAVAPVTSMVAAPAAGSKAPVTKAAPAAAPSKPAVPAAAIKAPAATAPVKKAPAAPAAATPAAPAAGSKTPAAPAAAPKAPVAAAPTKTTPAAPAAATPAAGSKAPVVTAPITRTPAPAAAGDQTASKAPVTKAPVSADTPAAAAPVKATTPSTPAAPTTGSAAPVIKAPEAPTGSSNNAPATPAPAKTPVQDATPAADTKQEPVAAAPAASKPIPTPTPAAAGDSKEPVAANPAAPVTQAPAAAPTPAPTPKEPAAPATPAVQAPVVRTPAAAAPATPAAAPAGDSTPKAPVPAPAPATATPAASTPAPVTNTPVPAAAPVTEQPTLTPATPAPVTKAPAPVTQAPAAAPTPTPATKVPATPAPSTPAAAPATKTPTPAPVAAVPAPATKAPATKAPITPAPATSAPAPATKAPATPAPAKTAPAPATKTPAPATKAPAAPAPATKAPAPAAPTTGSKPATPAKNTTKATTPPTTRKTPLPPTTGKTPAPSAGKTPTPAPRTQPPTTTPKKNSDTTSTAPKVPDSSSGDVTNGDVGMTTPLPPRRVVGRGGRSLGIARGDVMATSQQYNRMLFFMGPHCWDANAVPILGQNREVLRPQPLFNFKTGGMLNVINGRELPADKKKPNPGFEVCMAVRHREFKWVGLTDKVYRVNGTHKEERSTEVEEPQATALRNIMRSAAEKWWQSVIMEPHSLEKPTFYLGLGDGLVTNMLVSGAHERTPAENIRLIPNGAAGFKLPGDRICFRVKIMSPGTYDVTMFYTSSVTATVKLAIGTYASILTGTANSLTTTLPAQSRIRGLGAGVLANLTVTGAKPTEACLSLVSSTAPGKAVFANLANIRFTKRQPWQSTLPPSSRKPTQPISHHGFGASIDSVPTSSGSVAAPVAVPAPGLDMTNPNNSWLQDVAAPAAGFGKLQDKWEALRMRNAWPDGQGAVFESMYSPYNTEDIAECSMCNPEV